MSHKQYFYGFDYLRAVLPFFVIAIHTKALSSFGAIYNGKFSPNLYDIIQFNIFYAAVPVFLVISLFLIFERKSQLSRELTRSYHLFLLYAFWAGLWILYSGSRPTLSITGLLIFLITGGQSIFYFLFSLACLSLIAIAIRKLPIHWSWICLGISLFFQGLWPILNMHHTHFKYLVAHWNPILFIPCVFVAKLLSDYKPVILEKRGLSLIILFLAIISAMVEWRTLIHPNHAIILATIFPSYARISPILSAACIVMVALAIRKKPNRLILSLSSMSLGLYCVHPFLESSLSKITGDDGVGHFFLLASVLSLVGTLALKQIFKARLI